MLALYTYRIGAPAPSGRRTLTISPPDATPTTAPRRDGRNHEHLRTVHCRPHHERGDRPVVGPGDLGHDEEHAVAERALTAYAAVPTTRPRQ
jgi:hypothetical protein